MQRTATATLALLLALSPGLALAQGTTGAATGTARGQDAAAATANPASRTGEAETTYAKRTMSLGALSLETSRVALEKLKDDDLKQFARFEVAEQEGIAHVLKSMSEPESTATTPGTPQRPTEAEVQANLDAAARKDVERLREAKAGANFDKLYLQGQIDGHQRLLQAQEDYLKTGQDREHRNVALLASGQIREHMQLLKEIQKDMQDGD